MLLSMKSNSLKINEIFFSIEGEGKRAGELAAFIRLTGCNLRCSYCDTTYAFDEGREMEVGEIVSKIFPYHNITLTGGEPLCQDVHRLIDALRYRSVNIETNGSIEILPYIGYPQVFFTVDYKCPSSGMEQKMERKNFRSLRPQDVLKFVVGSIDDLEKAHEVCKEYKPICPIYISPVFGKIQSAEIVEFMKKKHLEGWRVQLQLHKFIWKPDERGV